MNFEEMLDSLCKENPEYKETIEHARLMAEAYDKGFKAGRNGVWIPIKDDLPDFGERVIVTDGAFVGEAYLNGNNKWIRYYCGFFDVDGDMERVLQTKITHWLPMPVTPKKEKDNEY